MTYTQLAAGQVSFKLGLAALYARSSIVTPDVFLVLVQSDVAFLTTAASDMLQTTDDDVLVVL